MVMDATNGALCGSYLKNWILLNNLQDTVVHRHKHISTAIKTILFQNFGVLCISYKFIRVKKLHILYHAKMECCIHSKTIAGP